MNSPNTADFYQALPIHETGAAALLAEPGHFQPVPPDWQVVLTDVRGSTGLVAAGRHEDINLVATGSVIAALNVAHANACDIPFFFGGDGATLLLPEHLLEPVREALLVHRANTRRNFDFDLRVGVLPVHEVHAAGHDIRIARLARNAVLTMPIVIGAGLGYTEHRIKQDDGAALPAAPAQSQLNLAGMECRWDRVPPPATAEEVVCLLVHAVNADDQAQVFSETLSALDEIYGSREQRNPISSSQLRLDPGVGAVTRETRVRFGEVNWRYTLEHWIRTAIIGPAYLRFARDGQAYVATVPELSETLTIDGRINTVISGTSEQRDRLTAVLTAMEAANTIRFGQHTSPASIMSCYVRNRTDHHIHFIDGAGGGYTHAAGMLKQKLRS